MQDSLTRRLDESLADRTPGMILRAPPADARMRHVSHASGEAEPKRLIRRAGQRGFHQTRVERILHVAAQNAVFDQHGARGGVASSSTRASRAGPARCVVDDRDAAARNALADAAGERAGPLRLKSPLQTVTDRLVQQNARPAGASTTVVCPPEPSGPAGSQRHVDRLARVFLQPFIVEEGEVVAPASAENPCSRRPACSAITVSGHAHQRAHVRRDQPVAARHRSRRTRKPASPSPGARADRARARSAPAARQLHLGRRAQRGDRVIGAIQRAVRRGASARHPDPSGEPLRAIDARCARPAAALPRTMSSEYEKAVCRPPTARTPRPGRCRRSRISRFPLRGIRLAAQCTGSTGPRSRCRCSNTDAGRAAGSPPPAQRLTAECARPRAVRARVSRFHDAIFQKNRLLRSRSLRTFSSDLSPWRAVVTNSPPGHYPSTRCARAGSDCLHSWIRAG